MSAGPISLDPNSPTKQKSHLPLAPGDVLEAQAIREQAQRLLKSKELATSERAKQAVELLLELPAGERAKAIDGLDAEAFANLLERVPDDALEDLAGLVESSHEPKRKLLLWQKMHAARADRDLARYEGDFGEGDANRTEAQKENEARYDRRQRGVAAHEAEVNDEVKELLAKEKEGKLTLAEVDAMRERRDLQLKIEMKHNVSLQAESTRRQDGSRVEWTVDELRSFDAALDKLPDEQAHGPESVERYVRRANPPANTRGAQYHDGGDIDVFDNAPAMGSDPETGRQHAVTHEVGHGVAHDNPELIEHLRKAAGWKNLDEAGLDQANVTQAQKEWLERRRGSRQTSDEQRKDIVVNGKMYQPGPKDGEYLEADESALPTSDEWHYAKTSVDEQFAEMYAKAVDEPQQVYADFVVVPAQRVREAQARVDGLAHQPAQDQELAAAKRELADAERIQKQRAAELAIIRNETFHTDRAVMEAKARLQARGVRRESIESFERAAARAMTPVQVAALERNVRS